MRYTLISLQGLNFQVVGEINDDHVAACRKGIVMIVDMLLNREMAMGDWAEISF